MKPIFMPGTRAVVALLFVVGLMGPGPAISSAPMFADPDIRMTFKGLMVFEKFVPGTGMQVVRLHCDAKHHRLHVWIKGPDLEDYIEWVNDYPKGLNLKLDVVKTADGSSLGASANWSSKMPKSMGELHPTSAALGELYRVSGAFGPTFTFRAGTFKSSEVPIKFVSTLKTETDTVAKVVVATIDLRNAEEICLLTGSGAGDGAMNPAPIGLRKPDSREAKWDIVVSNDPDLGHVCGYHFSEYYKGFRFTVAGEVPELVKYIAKPADALSDPCDHLPLSVDQMTKRKEKQRAIPSRPCIPVSD